MGWMGTRTSNRAARIALIDDSSKRMKKLRFQLSKRAKIKVSPRVGLDPWYSPQLQGDPTASGITIKKFGTTFCCIFLLCFPLLP